MVIAFGGLKIINIKALVIDSEKALMNIVIKHFPSTQTVAFYFHYKKDIIWNIKSFGLYKDK